MVLKKSKKCFMISCCRCATFILTKPKLVACLHTVLCVFVK